MALFFQRHLFSGVGLRRFGVSASAGKLLTESNTNFPNRESVSTNWGAHKLEGNDNASAAFLRSSKMQQQSKKEDNQASYQHRNSKYLDNPPDRYQTNITRETGFRSTGSKENARDATSPRESDDNKRLVKTETPEAENSETKLGKRKSLQQKIMKQMERRNMGFFDEKSGAGDSEEKDKRKTKQEKVLEFLAAKKLEEREKERVTSTEMKSRSPRVKDALNAICKEDPYIYENLRMLIPKGSWILFHEVRFRNSTKPYYTKWSFVHESDDSDPDYKMRVLVQPTDWKVCQRWLETNELAIRYRLTHYLNLKKNQPSLPILFEHFDLQVDFFTDASLQVSASSN